MSMPHVGCEEIEEGVVSRKHGLNFKTMDETNHEWNLEWNLEYSIYLKCKWCKKYFIRMPRFYMLL